MPSLASKDTKRKLLLHEIFSTFNMYTIHNLSNTWLQSTNRVKSLSTSAVRWWWHHHVWSTFRVRSTIVMVVLVELHPRNPPMYRDGLGTLVDFSRFDWVPFSLHALKISFRYNSQNTLRRVIVNFSLAWTFIFNCVPTARQPTDNRYGRFHSNKIIKGDFRRKTQFRLQVPQ